MPAERANFFRETRPFTSPDMIAVARTGSVRPTPHREVFNASKHHLEREQHRRFLTKEWLQEEVARVRDEPIPAGETPWYHLAGTGFWVKEQVAQLLRNTIDVGKEAYPAVVDLELAKVQVDVESFEQEYLKQMASLKWNLAWEERDGQLRVVCPDYGNVLWQEGTSKDEREGIVYDTLFGDEEKGTTGVEGWLRVAPNDSFAIMVSPRGWSGLVDAAGNKIRYPETQIYAIHKKPDGNLQTYTFRSDANILQNEELQRRLGLSVGQTADQKERIKNTLKNVALLTPKDAKQAEKEGRKAIRTLTDIVDLMEEVAGTDVAYGEGITLRTFDDIRNFLAHPEDYSKRHPLTGKLIQRFQDYARVRLAASGDRAVLEKDLQIALALTPLHLNRLYRDEEQEEQYVYTGDGITGTIRQSGLLERLSRFAGRGINYQQEKDDLRRRKGCAGGDKDEGNVSSMGGVRSGESLKGPSEDYDFDHDGTCVVCNAGPKRLGPCDICASCDASLGGKGE